MAGASKLLEVLPDGYGYVILIGIDACLLNTWLAMNVSRARKEMKVPYPIMYSADNNDFNCVQRAHQNTLENFPTFMFLLVTGGLQYPRITAAAGAVYILGRIAYAKGYTSGDPANRKWGAFGYIGLLTLLGNTISFAAHQLKWVGPGCGRWR